MKSFVTGGAGFIGSHVVKELVKRGHAVRVLVQKGEPTVRLEGLDVEFVTGALESGDTLKSALEGCDFLFHLAALHAQWLPDYDIMYRVNVDGTKNLLAAAREVGIKRVVHTSTQNVIGFNPNGLSDENTPFLEFDTSSHYTKSKYLAEQEALAACRRGLDVVIVNPSGPFGAGDTGPTGHIIISFLKKKMPFYFDGWFNAIDVEDLAVGHVLALEKGASGERYIMGNFDFSIKEFFDILERLTGIEGPKRKLPKPAAYALGFLFEFISDRFTRKPPKMSVDRVRQRGRKKLLDVSKARSLGLPRTPIEVTLKRAIDWYRANGHA